MKENISLERNTSAKKLENEKIEVNRVEFEKFKRNNTNDNSLGIEFVSKLQMDVSIKLSKTKIKAKEVLELKPGDVIKLDTIAGDYVSVLLNNNKIAKGEVLVLDENYGIRINRMRSKKEED